MTRTVLRRAVLLSLSFALTACTSSSKNNESSNTAAIEATEPTETADTAAASSSDATVVAPKGSESTVAAAETDAAATQTGNGFAPLNPAVGYGLLRVMELEERPNPRDVVIYDAIPNELPRIAGVITTVEQTPLSHVNLRAIQDKVPNAYVKDALDNEEITALVGRYVKYTVTPDGFSVTAATQTEVETHHAAARPTAAQTPERDLSVREIAPLSKIGFDDWKAYGVKAANVAVLGSLDLPDAEIPTGYAVPFSFYDEFMQENGFYDRIRSLLDDSSFRSDPAAQDEALAKLRAEIKDAAMPAKLEAKLLAAQQGFTPGTSIRCRSSTNNEDLPNFSGAGLYDSKTQRPEEGSIAKCVKQVYASVWNLRAFLERDFYRIDHLSTAMGVLLHPNFDDEKANGVAVSADPVYDTPGAYYVNTQLGEDLVTNPDAKSIPEALLIGSDGAVAYASRSNLITPGEALLSKPQIAALRSSLSTIHDEFAKLYDAKPGEKFAMEVEFKITAGDGLSIKQARTWIFSS